MITADTKDPNESEYFEFEYHRLLSDAEMFTGFEQLRLNVSKMGRERAIMELQNFIQNELEMRDSIPHKIEDINRKVKQKADLDDYYELQRKGKSD